MLRVPIGDVLVMSTQSICLGKKKKKKLCVFMVDWPSLFLAADPSSFSRHAGKKKFDAWSLSCILQPHYAFFRLDTL